MVDVRNFQWPANVEGKVIGWGTDGKFLENKDVATPADLDGKQDASDSLTTLAGTTPGTTGLAVLAGTDAGDVVDSLGLPDIRTYGAVVDGTTSDRTAILNMITAKSYARLANGTSMIPSSTLLGSDVTLVGDLGLSKILIDAAMASGSAPVRVGSSVTAGARALIKGVNIESPLTTNSVRGVSLSFASDVWIDEYKASMLRNGNYPIFMGQGDVSKVMITNFDIKTEDRGIIWKPNISAPTSNTYTGFDLLINSGRIAGQGTINGKTGILLDGNARNALVTSTQITGFLGDGTGTGGDRGSGWSLANDGALGSQMHNINFVGNSGRNLQGDAFHVEDQVRSLQVIGMGVSTVNRGGEVIANATGRLELANFIGFSADTVEEHGFRFISDSVSTAWEQVNFIGGLFYNWGTDGASIGLRLHGAYGNRMNILANHFRSGTGDAISIESSGLDSGTSGKGGIVVSMNTVENNDGYALNITSSGSTGLVHIKSDNSFSRAQDGVVSTGSSFANVSTDQRIVSDVLTAGASAQELVVFRAQRAGYIANARLLMETTDDSTTSNFFKITKYTAGVATDLGTYTAASSASNTIGTARSMSTLFSDVAAHAFAAGDVITVAKTASGDGTYKARIQLEYFEYF